MVEGLAALCRRLGAPGGPCILAEGNVGARADEASFWIKGSGLEMATIDPEGFSRVALAAVLDLIRDSTHDETALRQALNAARIDGPEPSTESFMHASLISLGGAEVVVHTHPEPVLSLVCLPEASEWAGRRLFPDEIVCCGPATAFVPYVAPGLPLARALEERGRAFHAEWGCWPKTLWLENHGLITVGATIAEAEAATQMAIKAARVLLAALQTGREPHWLSEAEVAQIHHWPDEHARRRRLFEKG